MPGVSWLPSVIVEGVKIMPRFLAFMVLLSVNVLLNPIGARQQSSRFVAHAEEFSESDCAQADAEQEALIREAEKGGFTLRRLVLTGNVFTDDEVLHRKIASRMAEGNLFSRSKVIAALKNVSKVKNIYPVTLKDVVARVDKDEKTLDLWICIKERSQPVRSAS